MSKPHAVSRVMIFTPYLCADHIDPLIDGYVERLRDPIHQVSLSVHKPASLLLCAHTYVVHTVCSVKGWIGVQQIKDVGADGFEPCPGGELLFVSNIEHSICMPFDLEHASLLPCWECARADDDKVIAAFREDRIVIRDLPAGGNMLG